MTRVKYDLRIQLGRSLVLAGIALGFGVPACGSGTVRSPFVSDAGSEAGGTGAAGAAGAADEEGGLNVGVGFVDPTLGGPCQDDAQCNDGISCTSDRCAQDLKRCRHSPDDARCPNNNVYCDGEEVCDPKLGCQAGPPVACSDADTCTIDTCVEKTHSCEHVPRDADGDGDPVWNCAGGGDCDDSDPSVSSLAPEVCNNKKDDNCNGKVDEKGCVSPAHDVCKTALSIEESGLTSLSLVATTLDYPTKCAPSGVPGVGDVVVVLQVPKGPPQNIDIVAESDAGLVTLASAADCDEPTGVECALSIPNGGGSLSRLRLYGLEPGPHSLYVAGATRAEVSLLVTYSPASAPPSNETCGTAATLVPGKPQTVTLVGALSDLTSACAEPIGPSAAPKPRPTQITVPISPVWASGELVYSFTLAKARDVTVFASPQDKYGVPLLSLRKAPCTTEASELSCRNGTPKASLFARALPPGTYYVSVAASGPSDVDLLLEEAPASDPTADEGCSNPAPLAVGATLDLTLSDHPDSVDLGCLAGAPDSTHSLTLARTSDVLLVERISDGDTGAVSLALPTCAKDTRLSCVTSLTSPVRASAYGVAPGIYRAVAESASGTPATITAFTRNAVAATLVPFADDCSAPFEIPATGGRFTGNTANAHADFSAGCDVENQGLYGAPDQMLHLRLRTKSRVVLDMAGSNYNTMLSVRSGAACPGSELRLACAAGYQESRSFLDLDLDSGDYYVQVDGYQGARGAWSLDVYVTPDTL